LNDIFWKAINTKNQPQALAVANDLLKVPEKIGDPYNLECFNFGMLMANMLSPLTMPDVLKYGKRHVEFHKKIGHPKSPNFVSIEKRLKEYQVWVDEGRFNQGN
jgi:hypothetical protein